MTFCEVKYGASKFCANFTKTYSNDKLIIPIKMGKIKDVPEDNVKSDTEVKSAQ